jgi:hypothetical protein
MLILAVILTPPWIGIEGASYFMTTYDEVPNDYCQNLTIISKSIMLPEG